MEFDWSRFATRIDINADPQVLYDAWSTQERIEYWFLRFAEYTSADGTKRGRNDKVQVGDTYLWRWHGYGDDTQERGEILECNGRDVFRFSFGEAGNCKVEILLEKGKVVVQITQTEIPTDERGKQYYHVGCKSGWTFHLTNMKSIFEGGADLRNKDEALTNVVNS